MKNGILLSLLSSLVFSVMNALVKGISGTIPAAEIAFFRGLVGTLLILILMRFSGIAFSRKGIPMLAVRGLSGGLYMLAFFYTLSSIPLTDASLLAQLAPIFVALLSALLLKEQLSLRGAVVFPVIFAGALLLLKPHEYSSYSIYAFVGLLSAFFSAAASISIRYLSRTHPSYEIVFYFVATSTLVAVPFMWDSFVIPDAGEAVMLLIIGFVSLLGQVFLTKAFTHENAVIVQVVSYFGLFLNVLFGYLFWNEVPDLLTVAGGIMIVAGCMVLFGGNRRSSPKTKLKL
ncbi:DMT family transporter [Paenibacillus sp. 1P03SA]|uniref:DMT family transporter n=1 Tax=Paenibacillus sp. 1P03SA TaxID=3132294 RepID=UPI0039A3A163